METVTVNRDDSCANWQQFIDGDEAAFRVLYNDYMDRLFSFGCGFCQDEEAVKDAVQDLFVDLYRYRSNLDPNVRVTAYLYSSFRRKLLLTLKKNRKFELIDEHFTLEFYSDQEADSAILNQEREKGISQLLVKEINQLSDRQREVLYLRFTLEMSYEEVAHVMQVSQATSRTLVYRAIKQLRLNMENIKAPLLNLLIMVLGAHA